jgi:hypothetical protein
MTGEGAHVWISTNSGMNLQQFSFWPALRPGFRLCGE